MSLAEMLPPGLAGYVAAQQQGDQRTASQLQQVGALQQIMAAQEKQQQDQALRQALAQAGGDPEKAMQAALSSGNVNAAHQLAPLVKMKQEAETSKLMANAPQMTPDQLDVLGQSLAARGHPGAAQIMGTADKRRAAAAEAATAGAMRSAPAIQPDPQEVQQGADQGTPVPAAVAAKPGLFAPLMQSEIPSIAAAAKNLQAQADRQPGVPQRTGRSSSTTSNMEVKYTEARTAAAKKGGEDKAGLSAQYTTDQTYKKNVDYWAQLIANGGVLPPRFAQSGAGKKMMPDILNVVPTIGKGDSKEMLANQVDLTGQKSEARAVGTRAAAVEMAAGEAREMMPILQRTSENFQRTGYQPINKVFKAYQDNTGSVESRQFGAALNSFVNVYARAVSPSGVPTVSDKDHAREILSTADSHEQLMGLLKVLDQEMVAAQNAPKRVREAQRAGMTGAPSASHAPAAAPTATALPATNEQGWTLHVDAKGNRAYVSPDGKQYQEVK
jgi:hypothetical protein